MEKNFIPPFRITSYAFVPLILEHPVQSVSLDARNKLKQAILYVLAYLFLIQYCFNINNFEQNINEAYTHLIIPVALNDITYSSSVQKDNDKQSNRVQKSRINWSIDEINHRNV